MTTATTLLHFAGRAGDHNDRAMQGSPVLARELADRLGVPLAAVGVPRPALGTGWEVELASAATDLAAMQAQLDEVMTAGSRPVIALSRCAVALATLPVVARHRPDAVVIWFDAHADINTPETSTTGYLGGLALSGPLGWWVSGFGAGLAPGNSILAGTRDIDPPEQARIDTGAPLLVAPGPAFTERLLAACAGCPVYVHIDCDVLDPGIVPTDYGVPGGLTLDDLHDALTALATLEVVGVEVGEFEAAPGDDAATAAAARRIANAVSPLLT
ncbi:arginase family protein [Nakamurella alba]|uniref:arginase family protein n=1 Tax=Nakamurella alba TaxID=2665158 RepID=UPI002AC369AE|nr:arginase family protein [Nakamurella alba]